MDEAVKNGRKVKDFRLKDQNDKDFRLADCEGKRVLLSFHPLAWTPVCAQQMQSLEKSRSLSTVRKRARGCFGKSRHFSPLRIG